MAPSQQRSDIPSGAATNTNNDGGSSAPSSLKSAGVAIAGFLAGTAITASISFIVISSQRKRHRQQQQQHKSERETDNKPTTSITQSRGIQLPTAPPSKQHQPPTKKKTLPPELRTEQLSRNTLYFGPQGMSSITSASVAVIGLGGVGSHAAHMLARSGIHYLRLVDFDQVTLSSLNRHACATLDDVGIAKAICLKKFLERICPDGEYMEVDARVQMYTGDPDKDGTLLDLNGEKKWGVIVDCIDDVPTKAALLSYCVTNNIRCVSCMGAGGKADVTRLHISDLRSASRDPLASKSRQSLKRLMKTKVGAAAADEGYLDDVDRIAVIYSSEKTVVKLAEFTEEQKEDGVHNFGAVDGMRIRVLPVLGTMPAIMGQSLASLVLCELGGKMFSPVAGERVGRNVRHRMFQHLKRREKKIRDELETKEQQQQQQRRTTDTTTTTKDDSGTTVIVVPAAPTSTTTLTSSSKTTTNDGSSGTTTTTGTKSSSSNNPNEDTRKPRILSNGTWVGPVQIDSDDVEYLLTEVWRNRCAVTGDRLGTVLELVRWDMTLPSTCSNLVLMGASALEKFDGGNGEGRDGVKEEVRRKIEQQLKSCRVDANA